MAKREGAVAASAATSAEGRRLLITKRTHCSHLHFRGAFSGHKNGMIFGWKTGLRERCLEMLFIEIPRAMAGRGICIEAQKSNKPRKGLLKWKQMFVDKVIEKEVFVAGRGTRERISGVRIRCRGFFVKSALDIAEESRKSQDKLSNWFSKGIRVIYQRFVLIWHRDEGTAF